MEKQADWQKVQEIFTRVLELDESERDSYLLKACNGDQQLFDEVSSLLFFHNRDSDFLGESAMEEAARAIRSRGSLVVEVPEAIGPFKIIECIGQGGMGWVYRAQQSDPDRDVALKVVIPTDTQDFIRRFQYEYQSLAKMNSPYIAQVYDAGITADRRPYFTMELISGMPIIEFCDENKLTIKERLALFADVCEGVRHAHNRGLIHRDLKPSNILIHQADSGRPIPKIIDFGIAKVLGSGAEQVTMMGLAGTPAYMSPEQADGGDIDTASDVYALGILLYELLCGFLPLEESFYESGSPSRLLDVLKNADAPRLTQRLCEGDDVESRKAAANRQTTLETLKRDLAGDLGLITLKAVEKNRHERYASTVELIADLQCYKENRPVSASPPGWFYLADKFIRRNRTTVVVATSVLFSIVTLLFIYVQSIEIKSKEEIFKALEAAIIYFTKKNDPRSNKKNQLHEIRFQLDKADLPPNLEITLRSQLGHAYSINDEPDMADEQFSIAVELAEGVKDEIPRDLYLKTKYENIYSDFRLARVIEENKLEDVIAMQLDDPKSVSDGYVSMGLLADIMVQKGCNREARAIYFEALLGQYEVLLDQLPYWPELDEHIALEDEQAQLLNEFLVTVQNLLSHLGDQELLYWGMLTRDYRFSFFESTNPLVYSPAFEMGTRLKDHSTYADLGEFFLEQAYRNWRKINGISHRDTLAAANNLVFHHMNKGEFAKAKHIFADIMEWADLPNQGESRANYLLLMNTYADVLIKERRYEEARELKEKELRYRGEEKDSAYHYSLLTQGEIMGHLGENDKSFKIYNEAFDGLSDHYLGTSHSRLTTGISLYLPQLIERRGCAVALGQLEPVLVAYKETDYESDLYYGVIEPFAPFSYTIDSLAECCIKNNKPERAKQLRRDYPIPHK